MSRCLGSQAPKKQENQRSQLSRKHDNILGFDRDSFVRGLNEPVSLTLDLIDIISMIESE